MSLDRWISKVESRLERPRAEELEERPLWPPKDAVEGELLIGVLERVRKTGYGPVFDVEAVRVGPDRRVIAKGKFTCRGRKVLVRCMRDVEPGEHFVLRYEGKRPSEKGNPYSVFSIARLTKAEYEELLSILSKPARPSSPSGLGRAARMATRYVRMYGPIALDELVKYLRETKRLDISEEEVKAMLERTPELEYNAELGVVEHRRR